MSEEIKQEIKAKKQEEKQIVVFKKLPQVEINQGVIDDKGNVAEFETIEQAITQIRNDVREIKKTLV